MNLHDQNRVKACFQEIAREGFRINEANEELSEIYELLNQLDVSKEVADLVLAEINTQGTIKAKMKPFKDAKKLYKLLYK